MLKQVQSDILVRTEGRGLYSITDSVQAIVGRSGLAQGLAVLHLQHTSASLLIQENADPEVRSDLDRFFERLVPDGDALFMHTAEGDDDMPAHVRTALTAVNLSLPFSRGTLALGTWQGLYLWEHRRIPHRRRIVIHLMGE
jgi:secondary thiamine-phosphate synthase enzyme